EDGALWVSDIILNVGGINTQAYWTSVNQNAARLQMEAGLSPQEIINWLIENDNSSQGGNITDRQYGIVDLNNGNPRAAAYTGANNFNEKGHRLGENYAIQGNILISEEVLNDMESAFLNTEGELSLKLMASLQAAKRPGADIRCLNESISSASAYIRVAKPTDTSSAYGDLWLDINVWLDSGDFTGDPIDEVQKQFDEFFQTVSIEDVGAKDFKLYPNPFDQTLFIESELERIHKVDAFDLFGRRHSIVERTEGVANIKLDFNDLPYGIFAIRVWSNSQNYATYCVIRKKNN
ncbi:MAG: DUF1028 domain-containing protein, partial [Bacteroidota bacterium]